MLPRENRMTRKNDFGIVLAEGEVVQGRFFGIAAKYQDDPSPPKVGIIVSKKISKLATKRNRIRRLLRESLKERVGLLPNGGRFVVLAKRSLLGASRKDIDEEFAKMLNKKLT